MRFCHLGLLALLPGASAAQGIPMNLDHDQMAVPANPICRAFLAKLMDEALSDSHPAKDLKKP